MDVETGALFTFHGRITTAVIATVGAWQIFRLVSRRKLGMAYGLVWLAICAAMLGVSIFPALLIALGNLAGSREPEGALRLAGFVFVAIVLLYLSLKVSALEAKVENLVQALALRETPQSSPDGPVTLRRPEPKGVAPKFGP